MAYPNFLNVAPLFTSDNTKSAPPPKPVPPNMVQPDIEQPSQPNQPNQPEQPRQLRFLERLLGVDFDKYKAVSLRDRLCVSLVVFIGIAFLAMIIASDVLAIYALINEDFSTKRMQALLIYKVVSFWAIIALRVCQPDPEDRSGKENAIGCAYCILTFVCFGDSTELFTEIVYWYMFVASVFVTSSAFLNRKLD